MEFDRVYDTNNEWCFKSSEVIQSKSSEVIQSKSSEVIQSKSSEVIQTCIMSYYLAAKQESIGTNCKGTSLDT